MHKSSKIKIDALQSLFFIAHTMEYSKKTRQELVLLCKEKKLKGYSGKKKGELISLLTGAIASQPSVVPQDKVSRLNYIGSKYQLLDWLTTTMKIKTGWESFAEKTFVDMFAGTGIVSYHFRKQMCKVLSNDAELYSSIITRAQTCSIANTNCISLLNSLQSELNAKKHESVAGFITKHYSPYNGNERKFFTVENAKRIDYIRGRIEELKSELSSDDYTFILASLLISADAVSNVPAVYGCYLKNFKAKATKALTLIPIHTNIEPCVANSATYNYDVLNTEFLDSISADIVYLDPPYNERQYSKNYFPLNIIAKTPDQLTTEPPLKGITGIPVDCFLSPFCKKGKTVENAFETLFRELKTKWIFLSYNSESIVSKDKMVELMKKYGSVSVEEREYKRFKSFEYNKDVSIKEYIFCLQKH